MNSLQIRKLNKYQAECSWIDSHPLIFPANSPGRKTADALADAVTQIKKLAAAQSSGTFRQTVNIKDEKIDRLLRLMQKMNRAAKALADEIDGIEDLFRMPRRRSEEAILAAARAFHAAAAAYDAAFQGYDLPPTFVADLLDLINDVENSADDVDTAHASKSGATGSLIEYFRRAGILSHRIDSIARNKLEEDPQKLNEWEIASHFEAAPAHQDEPAVKI